MSEMTPSSSFILTRVVSSRDRCKIHRKKAGLAITASRKHALASNEPVPFQKSQNTTLPSPRTAVKP